MSASPSSSSATAKARSLIGLPAAPYSGTARRTMTAAPLRIRIATPCSRASPDSAGTLPPSAAPAGSTAAEAAPLASLATGARRPARGQGAATGGRSCVGLERHQPRADPLRDVRHDAVAACLVAHRVGRGFALL